MKNIILILAFITLCTGEVYSQHGRYAGKDIILFPSSLSTVEFSGAKTGIAVREPGMFLHVEEGGSNKFRGMINNLRALPLQSDSLPSQAKNALYLEIATIVLAGGVSVNYERMLTDNISVRTGLGAGYYTSLQSEYSDATAIATMGMLNLLTAGNNHKFEIGAGVSVIFPVKNKKGVLHFLGDRDFIPGQISFMPACALGYRYQQSEGGFFFRAGLSLTYLFGFPFQLSAGYTF